MGNYQSWLWNLYAFCYDSIMSLKPYQDLMTNIVFKAEVKNGHKILDIGCGTGNLCFFLKKKLGSLDNVKVMGVDLSSEMLKRARRKFRGEKNASFLRADVFNLPFCGEKFDRIVINNVLYLFSDKAEILKKAAEFLKPGGKIIASTPKPGHNPAMILKNHGFADEPDDKWRGKSFGAWVWYILRTFRLDLISVVKFICVAICNKKLVSEAYTIGAEDLKAEFEKSGFAIVYQGVAYAGQNYLVVAVKL